MVATTSFTVFTLIIPTIAATHRHVDVTVDAFSTTAFEHKWKRSFGSGHASLTLRSDWRRHLKRAAQELGLEGVRYHGLFDDDMGPVVTVEGGITRYNFTALDSTWDFLLSSGVRPIVELSFMPAFVANCAWHGHCQENARNCTGYWCTQCNGHGVGPIVNPGAPANCSNLEFHYQGIKQVPFGRDYAPWIALVTATVQHTVERYGLAEVQHWSFEVWNELWGMPFPDDYMSLYAASAQAVKSVDPSLAVGGPATAVLGHLTDFVDECGKRGAPFDFVTTHSYPSDVCPHGDDWDPDCFFTNVLAARATVAAQKFLLTEYNVGCCLGYPQHDTPAAAAFIFRAVGALNEALASTA
jgi:xylan 1,4-beta-xylosidase